MHVFLSVHQSTTDHTRAVIMDAPLANDGLNCAKHIRFTQSISSCLNLYQMAKKN